MHADAISLLLTYRYWVIVPLALFEGPMIAMIIGFLASLGFFSLIPAYIILTSWDIIRDIFCYHLGLASHNGDFIRKYSKKIHMDAKHFRVLEKLWNTHSWKTMFLAKFAFGLSSVLMMTAGVARMRLFTFVRLSAVVSMVEYGGFLLLGYYFGDFYETFSKTFNIAGYVIAGVVALVVIGYIFFGRHAQRFFLGTSAK